jgi:hypothetical protein
MNRYKFLCIDADSYESMGMVQTIGYIHHSIRNTYYCHCILHSLHRQQRPIAPFSAPSALTVHHSLFPIARNVGRFEAIGVGDDLH